MIHDALKEVVDIVAETQKALADGKVSFLDAIKIAIEAKDILPFVAAHKQFLEEARGLTESEIAGVARQLADSLGERGLLGLEGVQVVKAAINAVVAIDALADIIKIARNAAKQL